MNKRRIFSREFKISLIHELESGKNVAQLSREHSISPSLICKWKQQYKDNPETAFSGKGNISGLDAKIGQYERIIGQLYAENAFLKKVLSNLETMLSELRKQEKQG